MDRFAPFDARLLDEFQRDFPLVPQPFAVIAERLGADEAEVLARLRGFQAQGAIARVGATVRPNTAGASTLAAMAVPMRRIDEVAALVGAEAGVNHSYLREDKWNLWFVATAADVAALEATLARIAQRSGLRVLDLRLVQAFNIDLGFRLIGARRAMAAGPQADVSALVEADRPLLHALSQGLDLVATPYAALADRLGRSEADVIARIKVLVAVGVITRLGVIVRHRALGWTSNAMVVWKIDPARIAAAGQALAAHPGVTLCYQRQTVPGQWPYALYAMIHAQSRAEAMAVLDSARALPALQGAAPRVLFSTRCFKQSGATLARAA